MICKQSILRWNDTLFAQEAPFTAQKEAFIFTQLQSYNLRVAPEKIQHSAPWKYLGWTISDVHIHPQKTTLRLDLQNLHDIQRFMGDIQWLRPVVGITNDDLHELRPLLKATRSCYTHSVD